MLKVNSKADINRLQQKNESTVAYFFSKIKYSCLD